MTRSAHYWSDSPHTQSIAHDLFMREVISDRYDAPALVSRGKEGTALPERPEGWNLIATNEDNDNDLSEAWEHEDTARNLLALVNFQARQEHVNLSVVASTLDEAHTIADELLELVPEPQPTVDDEVRVYFWNMTRNGPRAYLRNLGVPEFKPRNYSERGENGGLRARLDEMIRWEGPPVAGGRLVLLHGDAGTGKTSIIRSLCHAWKSWADIHYIVDPEKFFSETDYLMQVMMYESTPRPWDDDWEDYVESAKARARGEGGEQAPRSRERWRLVIIEDAGELLAADAKEQVGQALARLLNLADGMIGQGMNTLILITTNEPLKSMHAAVTRPGRCVANLQFPKLTAKEATEWLERSYHEATLAELYEQLRKGTQLTSEPEDPSTGQYV